MPLLHPGPEAGAHGPGNSGGGSNDSSDGTMSGGSSRSRARVEADSTAKQGMEQADSPGAAAAQLPPIMSFSAFLAQQQLWSDLIGNLIYFPIALGFVGEAIGHPLGAMTCQQQREAGLALGTFPCEAGSGFQVGAMCARATY